MAPRALAALDSTTFAALADAVQSSDGSATDGGRWGTLHSTPSEGVADDRVIGRLGIGPADASFSAWVLDTTWLRLPLAAAIFTLVAATVLRPATAKVGGWLSNHPPLTLGWSVSSGGGAFRRRRWSARPACRPGLGDHPVAPQVDGRGDSAQHTASPVQFRRPLISRMTPVFVSRSAQTDFT